MAGFTFYIFPLALANGIGIFVAEGFSRIAL
jgi:hypothetical protein